MNPLYTNITKKARFNLALPDVNAKYLIFTLLDGNIIIPFSAILSTVY